MAHLKIRYNVPVIYYHSIGPVNRYWYRNFLTTLPEIFEQHLKFLVSRFSVITLKELWMIRSGYLKPVKNSIIINLDDGYLDNFLWAFPLIKKYGVKVTIFISPDFVDRRKIVRSKKEDESGFLSWEEMKIMEASGLVDIQSHTMTHSKYFISEKITDFHNYYSDYLYPIGNLYPEQKPYYIGNKSFKELIPYGYPFFEESSSVIARKIEINPEFTELCIKLLKNYDFDNYNFSEAFEIIKPYYFNYLKNNKLIISRESEDDYRKRVHFEIAESKRIIEEKLGKKVEFLCWPHGDNNEELHKIALNLGYLMTTKGKAKDSGKYDPSRIPERMGIDFSTWYKKYKTILKLNAYSDKSPYSELMKILKNVNTFRYSR